MTRNVLFAEGEFYHVYNRGVDKRDIFIHSSDYQRFQKLLYLSNSSIQVNVRNIERDFDSSMTLRKKVSWLLLERTA